MHSPLLARMAQQKDLVLQLAYQLDQASTSEDQIRLRDQLKAESNTLARMIAGFRRRMIRGAGGLAVQEVSPEQAKARTNTVTQRIKDVNQELAHVALMWNQNKGNAEVRQNIRIKYQLLLTERVHLQRRLTLLQHGRDYVMPRWLSAQQVAVVRKKLGLPPSFPTPTVDETGALVGLLATRIHRRKEDTDATFRERLVAYLRRALVRWANRKATNAAADEAVVGAVAETLQEDSAALEAEAAAGGTVRDPAADVFVPLVDSAPVQEQVEAAIDTLQPTIAQNADPGEVVVEAESLIHQMQSPKGSELGQLTDSASVASSVNIAATPAPVTVVAPAPSPTAAYYPGTAPTVTSRPARQPRTRRVVRVPRVPTFSKAAGKQTAPTAATLPASTMIATDAVTGEEVEVIVPTEVAVEETASSAGSNKLLLLGVGAAVLIGGYLLLRRD